MMLYRLFPLTTAFLLGSALLWAPPAQADLLVGVHIGGPACYAPPPVVYSSPVVIAPPSPVVAIPAPPAPVIVHERPLWHVQYRTCLTGPWYEYAAYAHRGRALHAEAFLARQGYEVRLVRY